MFSAVAVAASSSYKTNDARIEQALLGTPHVMCIVAASALSKNGDIADFYAVNVERHKNSILIVYLHLRIIRVMLRLLVR